MKERKYYLDLIRVIACIMVIIMHSPVPESINPSVVDCGPFLVCCSYLTAPSVPLFFMVSGALLLPCKENVCAYEYLKKRLSKVLGPTLFFSIVYIARYSSGVTDAVGKLLSVPFSVQGHGVLWFMYTLIGLYLLVPVLSHWLRNVTRQELELYLCLWGVSLLYPFLGLFFDIETSTTGVLYYFTGYAGYFLLGHYLSKYDVPLRIMLPLGILMLPLPLIDKILNLNLDFYSAFWYLSITVALMTSAWFVGIKKMLEIVTKTDGGCWSFVESTSNYSFGIYLVHIFLMRTFIWHIPFVESISNYYLQTIAVVVLTFVGAWIFSWLVAKLPFAKYIIGYSSKKGTL